MKSAPWIVLSFVLAAQVSWADVYGIAKQQARRDAAMNDAEQQRIANEANGGNRAAAPGAAAPAPVPMDPALQATLGNINSLQGDFTSLTKTTGTPDATAKVALLNDLSQAAQGKKPATATIKKVADDLRTSLTNATKLTPVQLKKMAGQIHALANGAHLTDAQQKTILDDLQKVLTDAGANLNDTVNLVTDLKALSAETK